MSPRGLSFLDTNSAASVIIMSWKGVTLLEIPSGPTLGYWTMVIPDMTLSMGDLPNYNSTKRDTTALNLAPSKARKE